MSIKPYENPDFALEYVKAQADPSVNRYEWQVTYPGLLQFLDPSVENILDYGCGGGIFTAGMNNMAKQLNPTARSIGTDASDEILKYAELLKAKINDVDFQRWDAATEPAPFQPKAFECVFAKLVLNYVSSEDLVESVMPRLRECLTDDGLLVAVLPNPLREVGYSKSLYANRDEININVGNFSTGSAINSYRHTYEEMMSAADTAGFAYGRVLGLPEVRFEPYKRNLMKIAHPMPMILDTLNAAKRWVYVFGATESSAEHFDSSVHRFENWRRYMYPEISDRASIRIASEPNPDIDLHIQVPHDASYDYFNKQLNDSPVLVLNGSYAEHLTAKQKIKLIRLLAKRGIRERVELKDLLIDIAQHPHKPQPGLQE